MTAGGTVATTVLEGLSASVRGAAHRGPAACGCGATDVLADRHDGTVVRHGDIVAKAHAPDADRSELAVRTAVAAHPALAEILLPPLALPGTELHGRTVTFWPYGTPVNPDTPDEAPWEQAATLLARLHRTSTAQLPGPLPQMRGPAKAALAVGRMRKA
ncbi:aminoglycoside phosphotransferase family protein, partial [Streptomyces sp. T-3]|nr:aminoglycoside phosphotransferase family protein [Streptomyces sp. T-3]